MKSMEQLFDSFRAHSEPSEGTDDNPFRLACSVSRPASEQEVRLAWGGRHLPQDILDTWAICIEARLFEDVDYGQWGLRILTPTESAARTKWEQESRPNEFGPEDIVLGEFLGDQELLLRSSLLGNEIVMVALPLDARQDWYKVGHTIEEFLGQYLAAEGMKFWEDSAMRADT